MAKSRVAILKTSPATVLRDYHERGKRTGVVFCRACGEENPATFEICWACGTAL